MDRNRGGYVDLQEFCEWLEAAEKRAGTAQGADLGVNEPLDRPAASGRKWHTKPLEMRAVNASSHRRQQAGKKQ